MSWTRELESEADAVQADLNLDLFLATVGVPHLIGSPALGLMAWPDLHMTVVCDRLDIQQLYEAAAPLVRHSRVRQLTVRNDTGV